jgi:hypothetical protein
MDVSDLHTRSRAEVVAFSRDGRDHAPGEMGTTSGLGEGKGWLVATKLAIVSSILEPTATSTSLIRKWNHCVYPLVLVSFCRCSSNFIGAN